MAKLTRANSLKLEAFDHKWPLKKPGDGRD
jgi:hypothetical protein